MFKCLICPWPSSVFDHVGGGQCLSSPTGAGLQAVPSLALSPVSPLESVCTNTCQVSSATIHSLGQQTFATCGSAHLQATQDKNRRESGWEPAKGGCRGGPCHLGVASLEAWGPEPQSGVCLGVLPALDALKQLELVWSGQRQVN